jgi:hypothetical protein
VTLAEARGEPGAPAATAADELIHASYRHFESDILARVRARTFGEKFGQISWTTVDGFHFGRSLAAGGLEDAGAEVIFYDSLFSDGFEGGSFRWSAVVD